MKGAGGKQGLEIFAFFTPLLLFAVVQISFNPHTFRHTAKKKGSRKKEKTVKRIAAAKAPQLHPHTPCKPTPTLHTLTVP